MTLAHSPSIVTDGLILLLDSSNRKSFLKSAGNQASLISSTGWVLGNSAISGFVQNGDAVENNRILDTDPWGDQNIVWGTFPSGNNEADGGWNGDLFNIDPKKLYRSSVWVRRTSTTTSGTFYLGLHTNGTGDSLSVIDDVSNTNPYWDNRNIGYFEINKWYLVVGHIFPSNYINRVRHPDSGIYTRELGLTKVYNNTGAAAEDVKFPTNATMARQRVYHYYCTDATSRLQFYDPRWDLIDGNEVKISELLEKSPRVIYDLSKSANHSKIKNDIRYGKNNDNAKGILIFNGITDTGSYLDPIKVFNPRLINYSLGGWVKLSDLTPRAIISFAVGTWAVGLYTSYINPGVCFATGYDDASTVYGQTLNTSTWYYIVGVREGTTLKVYVNGILSNSKTGVTINDVNSDYLQVGRMRAGQHEFFGSMSNIQMYNKALTDLEIKQNFNAHRGRFGI